MSIDPEIGLIRKASQNNWQVKKQKQEFRSGQFSTTIDTCIIYVYWVYSTNDSLVILLKKIQLLQFEHTWG